MIHVCWHEGTDGFKHLNGRSGYSCCTMLNQMFDKYDCTHWSTFPNVPKDVDCGVFVIQGGNERLRVEEINRDARHWKWVIFIVIGDEGCDFPLHQLRHKNKRVWMQMAQPVVCEGDRNFIDGYSRDTPRLADKSLPKMMDWFFAGQDTHVRRHQCVAALRQMQGGLLIPTKGFMQGLPLEEYFFNMNTTRVVPCPSGPATPDSMRMCEALECGAVPIIDNKNPRYEGDYWKLMFGDDMPPFPIVDDWSALPEVMDAVLKDWENISSQSQVWWERYNSRFYTWLWEDMLCLTE